MLERLAAGDRLALARVTRMATVCLRRLGAYDLGDEHQDLCQEVVWALVRAVREGRAPEESKVHAYVAGIVRNQFVTWLRRRSPQPTAGDVGLVRFGSSSSSTHVPAGAMNIETFADGATSSGDGEASHDGRLAARHALSKLPHDWQSLLVAHYVEGCTIGMLVTTNGTTRATLNREIKRAREAFRAALSDGREAEGAGRGRKAGEGRSVGPTAIAGESRRADTGQSTGAPARALSAADEDEPR